jgi:N-acetylmuramoyl-L-alanine amidase
MKQEKIKVILISMEPMNADQHDRVEESENGSESAVQTVRQPKTKKDQPFTFWRGLQTAIGAAFVIATIFTLWTPGSLVASSLEARMAEALESELVEEVVEATLDSAEVARSNRIGIVAGHYGADDPGAVCPNGATEVSFNLEIATLVQKALTDLGYQVDLLEEFDDRLDGYQAAVVVSIHLDSCQYINDLATGYKVAGAISNQDYSASQRLTACLSERYGEITGLPYHAGSVTDDMTYYHAFNEIAPETNAAIIEAGFLNQDYQFITEQTDTIAEGIVAGILCFLNGESPQSTQVP